MRVIGFNFKKISIEKFKEINNSLKINLDINIIDIKKTKIDLFKNQEIFSFDYEYKINYEPDFAILNFLGSLHIIIDDKELSKNIELDWKSKDINIKQKININNIILSRCNLKALQLEEEAGLPLHTPPIQLSSNQTDSTLSPNRAAV